MDHIAGYRLGTLDTAGHHHPYAIVIIQCRVYQRVSGCSDYRVSVLVPLIGRRQATIGRSGYEGISHSAEGAKVIV